MSFEVIQQQYKIPAAKGMRIDVRGRMATITGTHGVRLLARFDDTDGVTQVHPVLGVTYPKPGELYPKESKGPREQHLSIVPDERDAFDEEPRRRPGRVPKVKSDLELGLVPLPEDDDRHGTVEAYRKFKCKCRPCKDAWNARCQELKAARLIQALDPSDPRHGTPNFYTNYDCRCRPCTDAMIEADPRVKAKGTRDSRPTTRRPRPGEAAEELRAAHAQVTGIKRQEMAS